MHAWNLQLHGVLLGIGFTCTCLDTSIYHHQDDRGTTIIILYVNDITILSNSTDSISQVKVALTSHYEMTDLGEISSYLGVNIKHDRSKKQIEINQSQYSISYKLSFALDYQMQTQCVHPFPQAWTYIYANMMERLSLQISNCTNK